MDADEVSSRLSRTIASTQTLKLAELPTSSVLYTPLEERFERITRIAARLFRAPVAAISFFDGDSEWFKSVQGWQVGKLDINQGLGLLATETDDLTIVEDATRDPRTSNHPLVKNKPGFRFIAVAPLFERHGTTAGAFLLLDVKPRKPTTADVQAIRDLCGMAQCEVLAGQMENAQIALSAKLGSARREALIDPLTRVWNRRGANMALKAALPAADDMKVPLTIGVIDVDNFKRINDTYGHDIGDIVLRKVAEALISHMRENDIVCRLGGDEFMVLLTDADAKYATGAINRVRSALADNRIRTRCGQIHLTVSGGFAVREPGSGQTSDALIQAADQALMASKSSGRNRVRAAS